MPRQRRRRDERRLHLRLLPFVEVRELAEQHFGDDEAEHGVAEELERLVVDDAAAGILLRARLVRQRVLQQAAIAEPVAEAPLERLELVDGCGIDHPAVRLVAVALDQPHGRRPLRRAAPRSGPAAGLPC